MDMELGKLIGFGSNVGMSNPNWPWGLEDCLTLLSELPPSACAEKELSAYLSMVPRIQRAPIAGATFLPGAPGRPAVHSDSPARSARCGLAGSSA